MKKQQTTKKSGFTIIEVVLVLAIAALIFLIVFLAVPALQRNQRDTQRRSDMGRMISQLQTYSSNHNGNLPTTANLSTFVRSYLSSNGSTFSDPLTGNAYNVIGNKTPVQIAALTPQSSEAGNVYYATSADCGNSGQIEGTSNQRTAAVVTYLEGSNDWYCVSNK